MRRAVPEIGRSLLLACACASTAALLARPGPARADEPSTLEAESPAETSETPAEATSETTTTDTTERPPDRPLPDYDGLPEEGDDAGDVALWTARVLTSPLYLVSEYVLRRPIGWAMTEIERHHVVTELRDFFTFGPDDNIAVFPTAFYELGFQPNVGLYAAWDEFLFPQNRISVHGGYGGDHWLSGSIADRIRIARRSELGVRFLARERPDYVFGGIGPNATDLPRARFGAERIEADLWSATRFWRRSDLEFLVRYRGIGFFESSWNGDPSVDERATANGQGLPYGYQTGYEAVSTELWVDLDTSRPGAAPEGGVRVAAHVGQHGAFGGLPELERWISWGASTRLASDALGRNRVLGLTAAADFITPLDGSDVPFTELVELGGPDGLLPGYRPGHIQGLSAVGLIADYTWPVWAFLDAQIYFGTANAFGRHLEDFDVELLRLSFGLSVLPRMPRMDLPFEMNFAFATDTFERGTSINSFRFAVGTRDAL